MNVISILEMIDPKTIYLTGEMGKFHKPGSYTFFMVDRTIPID